MAACWGYEFDASLVGEALGLRRLPVLQAMAKIEKRDRLVRSSGRQFVFDHHQVQEALYGALPEMLREEYHAALAEALEVRAKAAEKDVEILDGALCVDLCDHYLRGARGESALRYLPEAQRHLTSGHLHAEMAALTERALAVPDLLTRTERANTLLRLYGSLDRLGRRTRQEECAREVQQLADVDDAIQGKAAIALGIVFQHTSRTVEAEAAFRLAQEIAVARNDQRAEALAVGNVGVALLQQRRLPEAQEQHERHLALSDEIGDRHGVVRATMNLAATFRAQDRLAEAMHFAQRSLALSRELGDRNAEGRAAGTLGNVLLEMGRWPQVQALYERDLVLSRETGDRAGEAAATMNLGAILKFHGRLAESKAHLERALALGRETGYRPGEMRALHHLGDVSGEEGDAARAAELQLASLALSEEFGDRYMSAATHLALGSRRAAAGEGVGARESLTAARGVAAEIGDVIVETLARCELACLPGGDADDALAAFTEHEERLDASERREARLLLWKATGDRAHLEASRRLLDEAVAEVDAETRELMLRNRRVNREIVAACREQGV